MGKRIKTEKSFMTYARWHGLATDETRALTWFTRSSKTYSSLSSTAFCQWQWKWSRSVVSNSLQPHEPQHASPPCPSPTARVHPNPCPLCWWCYPSISSSVMPFSSCPQSFPASGSFQMSQLFTLGGQSTGVSASVLVLPMNIQD